MLMNENKWTRQMKCDNPECDGNMVYADIMFLTYRPTYGHLCTKCDNQIEYYEMYDAEGNVYKNTKTFPKDKYHPVVRGLL